MGRISDTYANALLDLAFSKIDAYPATFYVGLSTTAPTNTGTNVTEPSTGGYARVSVTNNASNWPAASSRAKSNGNSVIFPTATNSWGTITHFVIYDAATAGVMVAWGELTLPIEVVTGATVTFAPDTLTITAPGA